MVKKRKSIRKPPTVVIIEGEEQLFESTVGDVPAEDGMMMDGKKEEPENGFGEMVDSGAVEEETEDELRVRENALEEWNAFKEEYHEIIEQLPLSLYRSMALLRELDDQVHEYHEAILPAIRAYVTLRMSIAGKSPPAAAPLETIGIDSVDAKLANGDSLERIPSHASPTSYAADGLDEGSSKSVSDELPVVVEGQTPVSVRPIESAPSEAASVVSAPLSAIPARLRPPNPFALQRSHSSFALETQKINEKPPSTREMLTKIAWLSAQTVKASEEKLGVATAAYNSVDRHVRALDAAIKEHENSLVFGLRPGTRPGAGMLSPADAVILAGGEDPEEAQVTIGLGGDGRAKSKRELEKERKRIKERERKERKRREASEAARVAAGIGTAEPEEVVVMAGSVAKLGMPVDPHEPRYCYCRQVSYGEMIGCDNENCANEWFHLGCVGLTEAPKGDKKFYCRDCARLFPSRKRKTSSTR